MGPAWVTGGCLEEIDLQGLQHWPGLCRSAGTAAGQQGPAQLPTWPKREPLELGVVAGSCSVAAQTKKRLGDVGINC